MLDPTEDRRVLLDLLRPPHGARIERLLGLTYTLDFESLVATTMALTDLPWDEDSASEDALSPLVAVRRAVAANAEDRADAPRMLVACHAGAIHRPKGAPRLAPWLESIVLPVLPPERGGIFHPKVWLVRWRDDDRHVHWRAVVGSRNCTRDRLWDAGVVLEGRQDLRRRRASAPLSELVRRLPDLATSAGAVLSPRVREALLADAEELRSFVFSVAADRTPVTLFVHGIGLDASRAFTDWADSDVERVLIVSPFVNKRFIDELKKQWPRAQVTLVSTKATLDELRVERLGIEPYELAGGGKLGVDADDWQGGVDVPPQGSALHAKLVILEEGRQSRVLIGSANATEAAWGRHLTGEGDNVEVTVILDGRSSSIGVQSVLDGDDAPWKEFLVPYLPGEPDADRKLEKQMEADLQHALSSIIGAGPRVTWSRVAETWSGEIVFSAHRPETGSVTASIRPMSRSETEAYRPVGRADSPLRWDGCSVTEVTAWFVARVATERSGRRLEWERVLLVPMESPPPEEREAAVMRQLVGDGRGILRFLVRVARADGSWSVSRHRSGAQSQGESKTSEDGDLTIQDLLRAVAEADLRRFQELDDVVRSLIGAGGETGKLPDGFDQVWTAMRSAMEGCRG